MIWKHRFIANIGHYLWKSEKSLHKTRYLYLNPHLRTIATTTQSTVVNPKKMIAFIQMNSTDDKKKNFDVCQHLVEKASCSGAKVVFLPEGCDYIAKSKEQSIEMAESMNGKLIKQYCKLAESLKIWISVGGIHIQEFNDEKIKNVHILINDHGKVVSNYAKTHLFSVEIPEKKLYLKEASYVAAGKDIISPIDTPCGMLALGICYDMRFPELSLLQRQLGAQILTFPSAFTIPTGKAHWHTLLRARAIETQCYVVAAAQVGAHNDKRSSYGHALVVDPWGSIISEVSEGSDIGLAEIDLDLLSKIRLEMPVFSHRRRDLYTLSCTPSQNELRLVEILPFPSPNVSFDFSPKMVRSNSIFLKTSLSQAFTNKRPFSLGHVLVTPERIVKRYSELKAVEVSDLTQTLVLVMKILRRQHSQHELRIALQDGAHAGQTMEHLHFHVMPSELLRQGYELKEELRWRDEEEMAEEASLLRSRTEELQFDSWLQTTHSPTPLRLKDPKQQRLYSFCGNDISNDLIFLRTDHSFGCLSSYPILPGHAYLSSLRKVSSMEELSPREAVDLFLSIQKVEKHLEEFFGCSSSTILLSDTTAPEDDKLLTVHIIPRKEKDFEDNDDIYELLLKHHPKSEPEGQSEDLLSFLKQIIYQNE